MNALRSRLGLDRVSSDESGFTMAEVIVALFVFTIFILGLGYSLLSMTRLVSDDENREVAASLASQEIDRVRAIPDAFDVVTKTTTVPIGAITYTIQRNAGWVSTDGSTSTCGGGGGNLQAKAVDVQVTWTNQYVITSPVRSSIVLAPATRINDPSFGTIIVSALGADGTGEAGVTVSVTNNATGTSVGAVDPTDSSGCSYVLKVSPGTYTVKLTKTGWISNISNPGLGQFATPVNASVAVAAAGSALAAFAYDQYATYQPKYATDYVGTATMPNSIVTTFLGKDGPITFNSPSASQTLFPYTDGYSTIAGNNYSSTSTPTTGCLSVDPVNWAAGTVGATALQAGARPNTGVASGTSGPINVRMGVIAAAYPAQSTNTITVKSAAVPAGTGDPGCATATTYTYTFTTTPATGTVVYLAVPFGSWQVYSTVSSVLTMLPAASVTATTRGEVTSSTVTLDPRTP